MKLFKVLSASALMLGAVAVSNAQETTEVSGEKTSNRESMAVSFGVKGGVNFATLNGGIESPDSRINFHAGALVEFPIAEIFSIQLEALYSGQGAEIGGEGPDGDDAELQLDYINVPLLAKFYIFEGFSVEAGPQFSFLLNDEIDLNPNSGSGDSPSPFRNELKTFEVGAAGGVTFQTPNGIFATARYIQGISNIIDNTNIQNSVFQLGVGYKF